MRRADDLALVRRARADRSAFDRLFDRYADRVHRLARRRATADLPAETLTARMLERVFSALADYDGAHPLDVWVLLRCRSALSPGSGASLGSEQDRQAAPPQPSEP